MATMAENMLLYGLFVLILVFATISNSLLLVVFYRRPGLRTISNKFVINLLFTNLSTSWILLPLMLLDTEWIQRYALEEFVQQRGIPLCALDEGISVGLCTACVLSVLMIGIDQYYAVLDPLRYHTCIKNATSNVMIAVCWSASWAMGICASIGVNSSSAWQSCKSLPASGPLTHPLYQALFPLAFAVFVFLTPFVAICWIYASIYSAAHENSRRTRSRNPQEVATQAPAEYTIVSTIRDCTLLEEGEYSSPAPLSPPKPLHHSSTKTSLKSTSSSLVNSLRHRISNASMFRYREETRAAKISALVIIMALCCWLPFTLTLLCPLTEFGRPLCHLLKRIGILTLAANAVASPLIFAHRNRRVHKELCRLFCRSKRSSFYDGCNVMAAKKAPAPQSRCNSLMERGGGEMGKPEATVAGAKRSVSIFDKVWIMNRDENLDLPRVAYDTDTSRSSFSSDGSSSTNNHYFLTSSISDIAEEVAASSS